MRPVNLLPARYRPRTVGAADARTTYGALAALALLVLAVFGYVMTANQVTSRNAEIEETRARIVATEAQVVTLQGFGDFATVKQTRLAAVRSLATARLDWERVFRELAHVLPERVWLTGFDGKVAVEEGTGAVPSIVLEGCAADHARIADVMVRLRELHVADDVELTNTKAAETENGETSSACGRHYEFELSVKLASAAAPGVPAGSGAPAQVPARLGGGQ